MRKVATVLGIDGGGTSTRGLLATVDGAVLGYGLAGPSNYDDVGVAMAEANIGLAVERAWQQAGQAPCPTEAAFLGMAGVVSAADQQVIAGIAGRLALAAPERVGIDHDIRIALAGGLALQPGIVLIAGTGSSCYGDNGMGQTCRVGGWGHLLDDDGSSYALGLGAIRAAVRSADGRLGPTALLPGVLAALGVQEPPELMQRVYAPPLSRSAIAALAPLVLEAARQGDTTARQLVATGHSQLAELVAVAADRLNLPPEALLVTTVGGLAHASATFKSGLHAAIRARLPAADIRDPALSPVFGAALLAIAALGEPSAEAVARFRHYEATHQ